MIGYGNKCGIAEGTACRLTDCDSTLHKELIKDTAFESARFDKAVEQATREVSSLLERAKQQVDPKDAEIFEAHLELLDDPGYIGKARKLIADSSYSAEWAINEVSTELQQIFESIEGDTIRERAADIRDVEIRIRHILQGKTACGPDSMCDRSVILAKSLLPSQLIELELDKVVGIITEEGGLTSHVAILAKARGIPMILGAAGLMENTSDGDRIVLDAFTGEIFVNPDEKLLLSLKTRIDEYEKQSGEDKKYAMEAAVTKDGRQILIEANIADDKQAEEAYNSGADGVGLFRSEFFYLNQNECPTEEAQYQAYRHAAEAMRGKLLIIRTMDIGGDKQLKYMELPKEENPFLGFRAIRVSLAREQLFREQLRAILKASAYGKIGIMFPMIATVEELRTAKAQVESAKKSLKAEGIPYDEAIQTGIMIEIPSAAVMSDELAKEADFFSIGTNDLIQYTMAADRMNEHVSYLYNFFQPAVLRLIARVCENAHAAGIQVAICGEAGGEQKLLPVWLSLGVDALSVSPGQIAGIKARVRETSQEQAADITGKVLKARSDMEVKELLF